MSLVEIADFLGKNENWVIVAPLAIIAPAVIAAVLGFPLMHVLRQMAQRTLKREHQ